MIPLKGTEKVVEYINKVTPKPLVSVCVVTYNHGQYIRACLDGILMQQVDFDFEILLGEDNSTDNTRQICIEYASKYPDKIRLFLHDRSNVIYLDGRPSGRYNLMYNFYAAKGKYIALCEGDDYWTDENKLQKQIDFLEKNQQYTLVGHKVRYRRGDALQSVAGRAGILTQKDFVYDAQIQTASMVFRSNDFMPHKFKELVVGDTFLKLKLTEKEQLAYCLEDVMSVYRVHQQGILSMASQKIQLEVALKVQEQIRMLYPHLRKASHKVSRYKKYKNNLYSYRIGAFIRGETPLMVLWYLLKSKFKKE